MVYKSGQIFVPFCHNPRVWRTDGRTDRILLAIPRLHYMQRGKNRYSGGRYDIIRYIDIKNNISIFSIRRGYTTKHHVADIFSPAFW